MTLFVLNADDLPESPLDAAARFHEEYVPQARKTARGGGDVVVLFPAAGKDQHGWRLAAIQSLARDAAPRRANAVEGGTEEEVQRVLSFLGEAPGVTGQILRVDGNSAAKG